jgi:hypothetical protein
MLNFSEEGQIYRYRLFELPVDGVFDAEVVLDWTTVDTTG